MSDKSEQIASQVHALWRGAIGRVNDVTGQVVRVVAQRIEQEKGRLPEGWLDRALKEGARLAEGETFPLPSPVRQALSRAHRAIETRMAPQSTSSQTTDSVGASTATSGTEPGFCPPQPQAAASANDGEAPRTRPVRKRRPRRRVKSAET
jgi:hypothetical protein